MRLLKLLVSLSILLSLETNYLHAEDEQPETNSQGFVGPEMGTSNPSTTTSGSNITNDPLAQPIEDKSNHEAIRDAVNKWIQNANQKCIGENKATICEAPIKKVTLAMAPYINASVSCLSAKQKAQYMCLGATSPALLDTIGNVGLVVNGLSTAGVVDKCNKIGQVMDIAKKGLSAYGAMCGTTKGLCNSSCEGAITKLKALDSSIQAADAVVGLPHNDLDELIKKDLTDTNPGASTHSRVLTCTNAYAKLLLSAGLGLMSVINTSKQANNCKCDAGGCAPAVAQLDCNGKDSAKQECICQLNPRMQGCPGADVQGKIAFGGGTNGPAKSNLKTDANTGDLNLGDDAQKSPEKTETVKGDIAGAPTGGSGMGDGGSLGGGSAGGGSAGKNLKPGSVLEGYGGGGGGAYGSYNSQLAALASKLGIAKPVERNVAGEAWTKQVTTSAGKSNWEKVKDRYNDNQTTLIGR